MTANVLQLPAVGDFWHYFSNISLNLFEKQIFFKALNRQLLAGAVMCADHFKNYFAGILLVAAA